MGIILFSGILFITFDRVAAMLKLIKFIDQFQSGNVSVGGLFENRKR